MSRDLLVLELRCPRCAALLTEGHRVRLGGLLRRTGQEGAVSLSAVFGDPGLETDLPLEDGDLVELSCPQCDSGLLLAHRCRLCAAPMASLEIDGGGTLEFCSRRGCRAQALGGAGSLDDMMKLMHRMLDTPWD